MYTANEHYQDEYFLEMSEEELSQPEPARGERMKATKDYDLFGTNILNTSGVYLKTDIASGKYLIYFPRVGEWAELPPTSVERPTPGQVSEEDQEFVSRIKTLVYTLEV